MEPILVDVPPLLLVGFSFFGDPFALHGGWSEENEIGRLWKRFMAYLANNRARVRNVQTEAVWYEVHIEHAETPVSGEFEIFAGLQVTALAELPVELSAKQLPAATYAVFTLHGREIQSDCSAGMAEWMARTGHERLAPFGFERYDERFLGMERIDESILDFYVPVRKGPAPAA